MDDINPSKRIEIVDRGLKIEIEVQQDSPGVNQEQPLENNPSDNQACDPISSHTESPEIAMGSSYQMFSQSMSLLAQNAVNVQKQLTMTQQTATNKEIKQFIPLKPQSSTSNSQKSLDNLQGIIGILKSLSE
ncbi:MAG: RebB family R body protein [Crocosphaera sp.]